MKLRYFFDAVRNESGNFNIDLFSHGMNKFGENFFSNTPRRNNESINM